MSQRPSPTREDRTPLQAHSLAEAHLYLMVQSCSHCGQGPLLSATSLREPSTREGRALLTMQAKCSQCHEESWFQFELPDREGKPPGSAVRDSRINPTGEPSRILDVTHWVTLHGIVLNAADRAADKAEARELRCEAAECLDEALRFYQPDSDLPPAKALFTEQSRRRLKDRPDLYIRQALLAQRQRLPSRVAAARDPRPRDRRRWWQFWR